MDTQDVVNYYSGLLIIQYASLGNAVGTVQTHISSLLQNQIIEQVDSSFDLEDAVGAQLNMLGTYRGLYRQLFGIGTSNFWSMIPDDGSPSGYYGWAPDDGPIPTWRWLQEEDSFTFEFESNMTDQQFRRLIKLKASFDSSPLTLGELDLILYANFGSYVNLVDNENMTITYQHQAADPDPDGLWEIVVLANILPNPCGVSYSVVTI